MARGNKIKECPKCGGTLEYFQTQKKYYCPKCGLVKGDK